MTENTTLVIEKKTAKKYNGKNKTTKLNSK